MVGDDRDSRGDSRPRLSDLQKYNGAEIDLSICAPSPIASN
jgi:hypothetical protein